MMMPNEIGDFNRQWTELLASERCPPVLGLAPLSEEDSETVSLLVQEQVFQEYLRLNLQNLCPPRFHNLLQLLRLYPAIMVVWLARKAGEAYEFGTFWELFETKLDVSILPNERPRFADDFKNTCKRVMLNYVEPTTVGAFRYVETFLFQAGLPLCYCQRFADCMREVERRYGLPDPESPEAGVELQESILTCTAMRTVPILKRAMQGAAGPLICYAALQVLLETGHTEINPALRDAIGRAFANRQRDQLHRSARFPYLRISEDLGSLEIIGPRQESNLVTPSGLTWVVNGVNYRTPHWDEFVLPVHENRLTVELLGLRGGLDVSRIFNPQLNEEQPFMIFDFAMRKQRRVEIGQAVWLKSGMYWLLHSIDYLMYPETMRNEWMDGNHAVSLLQLHPGDEVQLTGPSASVWYFKADQSPFCEFASNSKSLTTDEGERIYYGWDGLMNVWIPAEVAATHWGSWSLGVTVGENSRSWSMVGGERTANMLRCRADITQFLVGIPPGLHRFEVTVSRPGRKPEFTWQFWHWIGLEAYNEGRAFLLTARPQNLLQMECRGFDIANNAITHRHIESPRHLLAFNIKGRVEKFHWTQSGLYLESFEKRAGRMGCPQSHTLGETFSASIDSPRFLRIWQIPVGEAEVMVNNQRVLLIPASAARSYVDVSLAHLSTIYPNGGEVMLHRCGENILVARFTRPLTPIDIIMDSAYGHRSLRLRFLDEVRWVKPRVHELTLGVYIQVPDGQFDAAGHIVFSPEQLPAIECSILTDDHDNSPENLSAVVNQIGIGNVGGTQNNHRHAVTVKVPEEGWPPGLWLIDLEVRRDPMEDWQVVMTSKGKLIPLLVSGQCEVRESPRQRAFWTAYEAYNMEPLSDHDLADLASNIGDLFDLLGDVSRLVDPGFAKEVRHGFNWLEHLFHEVGRLAGKALINADELNTAKLLNLACIETGRGNDGFLGRRTLFVTVPELLALPADHYLGISTAHPLAESLRWCARLAVRDSVFDVFRSLVENVFTNRYLAVPEVYRVLQCFRNFNLIIQTAGAEEGVENLTCFNYHRYFHAIIGTLHAAQPQPEWDERTVLSRTHIEWALNKFSERRHVALDNMILGRVTALLNLAQSFRDWLRLKLQPFQQIMPLNAWAAPWLDVSMENDALMEHCCRFASVFALASRAAAAERADGGRWLCFEDVIEWLTERGASHNADEATIATLVGMAPELFGYYLMFWELMIRTYPHD